MESRGLCVPLRETGVILNMNKIFLVIPEIILGVSRIATITSLFSLFQRSDLSLDHQRSLTIQLFLM